jgi:hypothetical protein
MVDWDLLYDLSIKLDMKNHDEKQYRIVRNRLKSELKDIFFKKLRPMFNNTTYYSGQDLKRLGWADKDGGVTLWIDTTKENRLEHHDNILECITYDHYGNRGVLGHHNNAQLQMFLDNIDIVISKLLIKI